MKEPSMIEYQSDPVTDVRRLSAIADYDLESPQLRVRLDAIARRAAERLDAPIGLVTIVLDSAQLVAGRFGIDGTWLDAADGSPVEWSFCANVVRTGSPYLVQDAVTDELQHDNPMVTVDGLRSYAGAPIVDHDGNVLGSCCAIGVTAREFLPAEIEGLQSLAAEIVVELEQHRAG
jgi:GAF domain-containing protein